jgi:hypothetical protein
MKKVFYTILFVAFSSIAITACTEDEVTPTAKQLSNGGGEGTSDPLVKK